MTFEKGKSGNPKGRVKGVGNNVTEASKKLFLAVMDGEVAHIEEALGILREENSEKYIKALSSLFPYFMPKKVETEITITEAAVAPTWFDEVMERTDQEEENLTK
tara:strand:- start:359 stop:673 length:315 start_codon:yes stop_codon:yes gene_type:complete